METQKILIPFLVNENLMEIEAIKTNIFGVINSFEEDILIDNKPGVYVFYDKKELYIGESSNPFNRLRQHIHTSKLKNNHQILIFRSDKFNKSAIYDIETKLIDLFNASNEYSLINAKVSQTKHTYFLQELYDASIQEIWDFLLSEGISKYKLPDIEKMNIFKFSPHKDLNSDQQRVVDEIYERKFQHPILIKGYPGTGKSIVASSLYWKLSQNENVALVAGTPATYHAFRDVFKYSKKKLLTKSNVARAKDIINDDFIYDTIIIDEGHRLLRKGGKGMGAKYMHLEKDQNEFDELMKKAKQLIFLYDDNQIVHDGDFNFQKYKYDFRKEFRLREQMRASEGFEFINFMVEFMNGNFKQYEVRPTYELRLFNSFVDMYQELKKTKKKNPLTRILSGYSREWISKKDPKKHDFDIDGIQLKWNSKEVGWINSEPAKNLKEVGYYSSVQGFDLNYSGVIIGKDIYLDENDEIQIDMSHIYGVNQKPKKNDPEYYQKLKLWTINRYKVLLSRASKGTFLYVEDENLRNKLKSLIRN